jgi:membrane protein DedA with SNARE-associated domain
MEKGVDDLLTRLADLPQWQMALAASWILLQGCVLPSIPEEIVIVSMGMLVGQGRVAAPLALVAVLAGLLPANSVAVFFGNLARRRLERGGTLGRALSSPRIAAASAALRRHGPVVVLVTRFTPLVRGPVYLAAGLSGLGVGRFFLLDAAAACIQVPLLLWIGSRLGDGATAAQAWSRIGWLSAGLVAAAIALAGVTRLAGHRTPPGGGVGPATAPPPC